MSNSLTNFLSLPYGELETRNLAIKEQRSKRVAVDKVREERPEDLTDEKGIKAVTLMFSDLEGRLHMLDYDKKFLVKSWDNLTLTAPRSAALRHRRKATCVSASTGTRSTIRPPITLAKVKY